MLGSLRIVRTEDTIIVPRTLLVVTDASAIRISVEERDVPLPLISMLLHRHYELGDELIDAGEKIGTQIAATLPYIWQGRRLDIKGVAVPLLGGPLLAVPLGFFGGRH